MSVPCGDLCFVAFGIHANGERFFWIVSDENVYRRPWGSVFWNFLCSTYQCYLSRRRLQRFIPSHIFPLNIRGISGWFLWKEMHFRSFIANSDTALCRKSRKTFSSPRPTPSKFSQAAYARNYETLHLICRFYHRQLLCKLHCGKLVLVCFLKNPDIAIVKWQKPFDITTLVKFWRRSISSRHFRYYLPEFWHFCIIFVGLLCPPSGHARISTVS